MDAQNSQNTPISSPENDASLPRSSFLSKKKTTWGIVVLISIVLFSFSYYVLFIQKTSIPKPDRKPPKNIANWNKYTNDQYGYSFYYPTNWIVESGPITIIKEIEGNKKIAIQKIPDSSTMKPSEILVNTIYKNYMQNFKTNPYLEDIEVTTIAIGIKNPYIITNVMTPDGLLGPQVWIPSEELFISANNSFSKNDKTFNTMIKSLTFKKPEKSFVENP